MKPAAIVALLVVVAGLAGCASTPVTWYTLVKPASGDASARGADPRTRAGAANHAFEFLPPGVPAQVDRAELVVVDPATRGVRVLEDARWLAPLPEDLRSALSRAYAQASNGVDASGLARPQDRPTLRIRTMLRRFELGPGRVSLEAAWTLQLSTGEAPRQSSACAWTISLVTAGGDAPQAVVNALQEAVAALGARIAAMGTRWVADPATPCPAP